VLPDPESYLQPITDEQRAQAVMTESDTDEFPPLLKRFSWTQAAPFKEERFHRAVSDTIGNNYSPKAMALNNQNLGKRPVGSLLRPSQINIP
jgi:dynein heavy chain